jgi:hypothetical protein
MDIFAHMLWTGARTVPGRQHVPIARRTVAATIVLAALPDVLQFVPVLGWIVFGAGSWHALAALATALPDRSPRCRPPPRCHASPALPRPQRHLRRRADRAIWIATGSLWIPLLGWWSHILIDVLTHSADFYPAPVLYPFTYRGFDGLAWNTPWFLALNYAALGAFYIWAIRTRVAARQHPRGSAGDR